MKNPVTYLLTATLHNPGANDKEVGSIGITIDDFACRKNTLHEPAIPTIVEGARNFFIEKINYVKQEYAFYAFYAEDESIFDDCITLVGSALADCISIDQVLCAIHSLSEGITTKLDVLLFFRLVELDAIVV